MSGPRPTSWLVRVSFDRKEPIWAGPFGADGRQEAKLRARQFVSRHFPDNVKILQLAPGTLQLTFHGEPIPFEEPA